MPSLLNHLTSWISGNPTPAATVVNEKEGITYGPAVSRITRTPVEFKKLEEGEVGRYEPTPLLSLFGINRPGTILVDPTQDPDISSTLKHEQIHQLLRPTTSHLWKSLFKNVSPATDITQGEALNKIMPLVGATRMGDPRMEAAAYVGAFKPGEVSGLTPELRGAALDELMLRMQQQYPSKVSAFRKLSQ